MSRIGRFFIILIVQVLFLGGMFVALAFDYSYITKNLDGKYQIAEKSTKSLEELKAELLKTDGTIDAAKFKTFTENKRVILRNGGLISNRKKLVLILVDDKKAVFYDFGAEEPTDDNYFAEGLVDLITSKRDDGSESLAVCKSLPSHDIKIPLWGYISISVVVVVILSIFIFYPAPPIKRKFKKYKPKKEKKEKEDKKDTEK